MMNFAFFMRCGCSLVWNQTNLLWKTKAGVQVGSGASSHFPSSVSGNWGFAAKWLWEVDVYGCNGSWLTLVIVPSAAQL